MTVLDALLADDSSFQEQRSLLNRLEAALSYAFTDLALTDDESQFERLRVSILQAASPTDFMETYGSVNAEERPGYAALMTLTDRVAKISGEIDVNSIWFSRAFVLPAIAALAVLLDRGVSATGDSRMTVYLRERENSLFGYELVDIRAWGTTIAPDGSLGITELSARDLTELTAHLTAASYFFMRGGNGVSIGSKYLLGEAGLAAEAPKKAQTERLGQRFVIV